MAMLLGTVDYSGQLRGMTMSSGTAMLLETVDSGQSRGMTMAASGTVILSATASSFRPSTPGCN
ncbi:hypothetical protein CCACVL1_19040 [Corchorus capsularis]|uniref:Uncharacterized protein n=1 Tax=Corchorus capsularis TaxID=210143 RepID=A0A1R3HJ09_COCAP|nr:hypothetical protein CCACVL1_19040 [Corchorus capsularis]